MGYRRFCFCMFCTAALALPVRVARADKLVITIRGFNPAPFAQPVEIKAELPARVTTNDVISAGGLDVEYDVKKDIYYVRKEMEFGPKEIRPFKVEIRDIWAIPEEDLARLGAHTDALADKLKGSDYAEQAGRLAEGLRGELQSILARQQAASLAAGTPPIQHIGVHETNVRALGGIKRDIARLENMVMATGQDPGELVGPGEDEPAPARDLPLAASQYKTAVITVTVQNTSPTSARRVTVNRELPAEILATDVLDAGGLEVGTDAASGATYVRKENVEIPPGKTVEFNVKVRDKWNVNGPRIVALRAEAEELRQAIAAEGKFGSVEQVLGSLLDDLSEIETAAGPQKLDRAYVAFHRNQARRLDVTQQTLERIRSAMRAQRVSQRYGIGKVKPPSPKTTWMIIYVVLGFLGLVSLLFFVRWYGKTKAERMEGAEEEK